MSRYSISSRSPGCAPFTYTGPVSGCATVRSSFSRSFAVVPAWICRSFASRVSSVTSSPAATSITGAMSGCQRLCPLPGSSRRRFLRSISMLLAMSDIIRRAIQSELDLKDAAMTDAAKNLSTQARKLSTAERLELVDDLLTSLDESDPGIDGLWAKEAEDRLAAYRRGELKAIPLQEVLAKYRVK